MTVQDEDMTEDSFSARALLAADHMHSSINVHRVRGVRTVLAFRVPKGKVLLLMAG